MTDSDSSSEALRARARRYLAGGVLHHLTALPERPLPILVRGQGSRVWDCDGREYVDYYMGSAALVLGHRHPEVVEAVTRQLEAGTHFFEVTPATLDLAQAVVEAVPSADCVKYAMSGTEAVGLAVRIARAARRRSRILKFEGAYHGSHDWFLWATRHRAPLAYPSAPADSPGIPDELRDLVLVARYNDAEGFEALLEREGDSLAAVLVEPVLGNIPPAPGFLERVREATRRRGIPLIFDEIVSGFRLALGGAQEYYGVVPDMTALGKALGGGHPIGALAGRRDLMDHLSPARVARNEAVLHVGTYSGNPLSCAAGAATLAVLRRPGSYERLHALAAALAEGLRALGARHGRPLVVVNLGPMVDLWFAEGEIAAYPDTWKADQDAARRFKLGLLDRGIWSPPGLKMFLSLAHDEGDIERTLQAADKSLRAL